MQGYQKAADINVSLFASENPGSCLKKVSFIFGFCHLPFESFLKMPRDRRISGSQRSDCVGENIKEITSASTFPFDRMDVDAHLIVVHHGISNKVTSMKSLKLFYRWRLIGTHAVILGI